MGSEPTLSSAWLFSVAFVSLASNLVGGDTNGTCISCGADALVHDRQTGQTSRVSVNSFGEQGNGNSENPALFTDGRFVASCPTPLTSSRRATPNSREDTVCL